LAAHTSALPIYQTQKEWHQIEISFLLMEQRILNMYSHGQIEGENNKKKKNIKENKRKIEEQKVKVVPLNMLLIT
jgi:hypothetical protein